MIDGQLNHAINRSSKTYKCDGCKGSIKPEEPYVRIGNPITLLRHKRYCNTCFKNSYIDEDNNKLIAKQTRYNFISKENKK